MADGSWLMVGLLCSTAVAGAAEGLDADGQWMAKDIPADSPPARAQAGLHLTDGSVLSGHVGSISNRIVVLRHRYFGVLRLATQAVATVRLKTGPGAATEEGVRMANGDWLPCRVLSMSVDHVVVRHEDGTMSVSRGRCTAIHLRKSLPAGHVRPCPGAARQFVRMRNGDVAAGELVALDTERLRLRRDKKTVWEAPITAVAEIWSEGPRLVPLTTLTPEKVSYTPQFDESFPVLYDRGPESGDLPLRGRLHERGVMCHPRTELVYRLDGKWTRFVAEIGLADTAPQKAVATFRVIADGTKKFDSAALDVTDPPGKVSVDVTGAKTLRLVVDYGPDGSAFGAHAVWARPVLVK